MDRDGGREEALGGQHWAGLGMATAKASSEREQVQFMSGSGAQRRHVR